LSVGLFLLFLANSREFPIYYSTIDLGLLQLYRARHRVAGYSFFSSFSREAATAEWRNAERTFHHEGSGRRISETDDKQHAGKTTKKIESAGGPRSLACNACAINRAAREHGRSRKDFVFS
jgi:hypothetical protein